jgi:acetolactate synthase-1/2/3 large subunit
MRTVDAIWQIIKEAGCDTIFMLPGGGASHLVDALGKSGLRVVSALHEQGAGYMALAYAQYRGLGVCLVTSGPGASNAITPCLAAWMDSVPLLIISGQVPSTQSAYGTDLRCKGIQEAPIQQIIMPVTKLSYMSVSKEETLSWLPFAIKHAQTARQGPVWLDLCQDHQGAEL